MMTTNHVGRPPAMIRWGVVLALVFPGVPSCTPPSDSSPGGLSAADQKLRPDGKRLDGSCRDAWRQDAKRRDAWCQDAKRRDAWRQDAWRRDARRLDARRPDASCRDARLMDAGDGGAVDACVTYDGGFRTQTQGGWGTRCSGNNPGCYRDRLFRRAFPSGLVAGCRGGYSLTLTSSKAVENLLPTGGKPAALDKSYKDPCTPPSKPGKSCAPASGGTLIGQLVSAMLSVRFDILDPAFSKAAGKLKDLKVCSRSSPCNGSTVAEMIAEGNKALGGCRARWSAVQVSGCLDQINSSFTDGKSSSGFLCAP